MKLKFGTYFSCTSLAFPLLSPPIFSFSFPYFVHSCCPFSSLLPPVRFFSFLPSFPFHLLPFPLFLFLLSLLSLPAPPLSFSTHFLPCPAVLFHPFPFPYTALLFLFIHPLLLLPSCPLPFHSLPLPPPSISWGEVSTIYHAVGTAAARRCLDVPAVFIFSYSLAAYFASVVRNWSWLQPLNIVLATLWYPIKLPWQTNVHHVTVYPMTWVHIIIEHSQLKPRKW